MIKLTYEGADISDKVEIFKCWHDMYASGKADSINIMIGDEDNKWDVWGAKAGDKIKVDCAGVTTGNMYAAELFHSNGFFHISAVSTPKTGFAPKSRAWQGISLLKLGKDIAANNGLKFKQYDVTDVNYKYILQESEPDFNFLHKRCALEGCAFVVFDGTLIMYSEREMENREPVKELEVGEQSKFKLIDDSCKMYGCCSINKGQYEGKYKAKKGNDQTYIPSMDFEVNSTAEANRFAKNMLRFINRDAFTGQIEISEISKAYAPASVYKLKTDKAKSFNTNIFLYAVRNDYIHMSSKLFFRRVLGEY